MTNEQRWFAGIDWASQNHHVFLTDSTGIKLGEKIFRHDGQGLAEMAAWLIATSGCDNPVQVHVAIEVPHGPVVDTLIERQFKVHSINPKQVDRFRDRFTLAGAKDDSRDSQTMASALLTDRHRFPALSAKDPIVIKLREWSRMADDIRDERLRLTNRMRQLLWRYYPAMLELGNDLSAPWLLELWSSAPTPLKASRIREKTVARILKKHRIRRLDAAQVLEVLRQEPVTVAAETTVAAQAHIAMLVERIRLLNQQIAEAQRQLDDLIAALAVSRDGASEQVK